MLFMKSMIFAACLLAFPFSAFSAQLATYQGSFDNMGRSGFAIGEGQWVQVPAACKSYVRPGVISGFAASATDNRFAGISSCAKAVITFDLEGSSFCQNQGGREVFYSPNIVAIQCM
jgi:hypothetical protein